MSALVVFLDIFTDDAVFGSCNAFAEGHCKNLWLVFHKVTVLLHRSSSVAQHATVEGDVRLGTEGSIQQSNMVIPKDAFGKETLGQSLPGSNHSQPAAGLDLDGNMNVYFSPIGIQLELELGNPGALFPKSARAVMAKAV